MNNSLLELIFLSKKRKDLILFLEEGPKTIEEIKEHLNASAVAVLPQLKKLRDDSLVFKTGDSYILSPLGTGVAGRMKAMVSLLNVFGNNYEFWASHAIECIPPSLRSRIGDLDLFRTSRQDTPLRTSQRICGKTFDIKKHKWYFLHFSPFLSLSFSFFRTKRSKYLSSCNPPGL
jgi:predicted transcriptional regulator